VGLVDSALFTAFVTLAHQVIDPRHGGVEGLAPLVQFNSRWIAVRAVLLVLFPLSALAFPPGVGD